MKGQTIRKEEARDVLAEILWLLDAGDSEDEVMRRLGYERKLSFYVRLGRLGLPPLPPSQCGGARRLKGGGDEPIPPHKNLRQRLTEYLAT